MLDLFFPSSAHSELFRVSEGVLCKKSHNLLHNFSIFLPIILFFVMKNIDFIGFYPINLCAHHAKTVFHPHEILITYMNLTGLVVWMKPLTRLFTWKITNWEKFNLFLTTCRILFWWYSWCLQPKSGREFNQPELWKWKNPNWEETSPQLSFL